MSDYDLIVIGGGSGGVRAARRAAAQGARVLLAECAALGGTCVNIGCVPKKLFYYAANFAEMAQYAAAYGYPQAQMGKFVWETLRENKNAEIARLNGIYENLLRTAGVEVVTGEASLQDAHSVRIGAQTYRAAHILLASGGAPTRPPLPGAEIAAVSDDLFYLPALPKRVLLVGGGYIALEFAGIFNGLGVETTLCIRADLPLRGMDEELRQTLAAGIAASGVTLRPNSSPTHLAQTADGTTLHLADGSALTADLVVFATGRHPRTAALNLPAVHITPAKNGTLPVDENYCTTCAGVYAIGDLIDTPALTPVATAEAEVFVKRVFGGDASAAVDYQAVPTAVFSRPSIATAGLTAEVATARGFTPKVQRATFKPMKSSFAGSAAVSFIKLVSDAHSGKVLGAQMLGEDAAEIMQGIAVAIKSGAHLTDFAGTVGIHPTSAEEFVTLQ